MVSTDQSASEGDTDDTSQRASGRKASKNQKGSNRRKSTISTKKIKDRFLCIIFCCFNHVRTT